MPLVEIAVLTLENWLSRSPRNGTL